MRRTSLILGALLAVIITPLVSRALGYAFGALSLERDLDKVVIPSLSMLGAWMSGFGAFFAALVALRIANDQRKHEHRQDAIRCVYHALAIINDLRGRLRSMGITLTKGGRPLLMLTRNAEAIQKRYEMLYDREIYRHTPGPVVDAITAMSGSFFGLSVLVEGIESNLNIRPHEPLPPPRDGSFQKTLAGIKKLEDELDHLFTVFLEVLKQLEK